MSNPETLRLQIELTRTQDLAIELRNALALVMDVSDHYCQEAKTWRRQARTSQAREERLDRQVEQVIEMNLRLGERLDAAGLTFDDPDNPMDDLKLVDAQLAALTKHRQQLLDEQRTAALV